MAGSRGDPRTHRSWDKVVSVAYLRLIGHTQIEAARAAGSSERSVRRWEADEELWRGATEEARTRWLVDAEGAARHAVLTALRLGNAELGKWLLERVDDRLAPPRQRHEHAGKDGQPILFQVYGVAHDAEAG